MADNPFVHVPGFIAASERFVASFTVDQRVERLGPHC